MKAIVTAAFETQEEEWIYPYYRLMEAGYETHLVKPFGMTKPEVGKYGIKIPFTHNSQEVKDVDYDIFIASGGWGAELCRVDPYFQAILQIMNMRKKTIGAICHGPWVLISANICKDKKMTCFPGMCDDVKNSGNMYRVDPVVVDGNIITSPHYKYNHLFMKAVLSHATEK
jgi:protease I